MTRFLTVFDDHSPHQIKNLLLTALRCPQCGCPQDKIKLKSDDRMRPLYLLACGECAHLGPFAKTIPAAIHCWNARLGYFASLLDSWRKRNLHTAPAAVVKIKRVEA